MTPTVSLTDNGDELTLRSRAGKPEAWAPSSIERQAARHRLGGARKRHGDARGRRLATRRALMEFFVSGSTVVVVIVSVYLVLPGLLHSIAAKPVECGALPRPTRPHLLLLHGEATATTSWILLGCRA